MQALLAAVAGAQPAWTTVGLQRSCSFTGLRPGRAGCPRSRGLFAQDFYGTDAAHLRHRAGMPGIVCGPGGRYNTMPDERVDIPDYLDAIRIYLLTILDVCGAGD